MRTNLYGGHPREAGTMLAVPDGTTRFLMTLPGLELTLEAPVAMQGTEAPRVRLRMQRRLHLA